MVRADRVVVLFETLLAAYGPQHWWPATSTLAMMAGAVLVQNTAWTGAARAVDRLEEAGCLRPDRLRTLPEEELWELIRPAGYFRVKAKRLLALAELLGHHGDDLARLFVQDTGALRKTLLAVHGVGKETADSILCYGAMRPIFVVDAYTRRLFSRLGWVGDKAEYDAMQDLVHRAWGKKLTTDPTGSTQSLGEFHALIVRHAKAHCRVRPVCAGCPVTICPRWLPQGA